MILTPIRLPDDVILLVDEELEVLRIRKSAKVVLTHGRPGVPGPYDYSYPSYAPGVRCFDAAYQVAQECGLLYVEGVLQINGKHHMLHGWCETEDGHVLDPINHKIQHKGLIKYFGVRFNLKYAEWWFNTVGYHGMLDGHVAGLPIGIYHDAPEKWLWTR